MKRSTLARLRALETQKAAEDTGYILIYHDGHKEIACTYADAFDAVQQSNGIISVGGNIPQQQVHIFEQLIQNNMRRSQST